MVICCPQVRASRTTCAAVAIWITPSRFRTRNPVPNPSGVVIFTTCGATVAVCECQSIPQPYYHQGWGARPTTPRTCSRLDGMNQLSAAKRATILHMLCEGASMRSTMRITDTSYNAISKLLRDAGLAAQAWHDRRVKLRRWPVPPGRHRIAPMSSASDACAPVLSGRIAIVVPRDIPKHC